MNAAIENLKTNQRQLDADGCEVGVSRQALDEALALTDNLVALAAQYRDDLLHPPTDDSRKRRLEAIERALSAADYS